MLLFAVVPRAQWAFSTCLIIVEETEMSELNFEGRSWNPLSEYVNEGNCRHRVSSMYKGTYPWF